MSDTKRGPVMRVAVTADGVPICPDCGQVMVTDDGETFGCPDAVLINNWIREDLARVLAQWSPEPGAP